MYQRNDHTKLLNLIIIAIISILIFASSTWSVSASPELIEQLKQSGQLDKFVERFRMAKAKGVDQPLPKVVDDIKTQQPALSLSAQTVDTFRVLILLADFSDNPASGGGLYGQITDFENLLFSDDSNDGHYSMTEFYMDNSYDGFYIEGVVSGWYRLPQTYAYYVDGQNGFGSYPQNAQRMAEDAIAMSDPYVDYTQFDNDFDGWCDGVFIVHAGRGAESTGSDDMIWSHAWGINTMNLDGVNVGAYTTEPEEGSGGQLISIGVFVHEYGHFLGLPDLYDTDYSSSGVGDWSVMAGGSWGGGGAQPVFFDAWCKKELGFLSLTNVDNNIQNLEIPESYHNPVAYRLWQYGNIGNEYFLIENRQRRDHDSRIPGSGLLIMHIDESVGGNRNEWHPLVAIEQPDEAYQLEYGLNDGDGGDIWSTASKTTFNDLSIPNTRKYNGQQTKTAVWDISNSDSVMTANFDIYYSKPFYEITSNTFSDLLFGNNNGQAEPGELITFEFSLTNFWLTANNAVATLSCNNPDVIFSNDVFNFGNLVGEGASADNSSNPFVFEYPLTFQKCQDTFFLSITSDAVLGDTTLTYKFAFGNAEVLLIDDDNGDDWEDDFIDVFNALSVAYDIYDKSVSGSPVSALLEQYPIVIWFTGNDRADILSIDDIAAMQGYMDNNGRLFLTGQTIVGELSVDDPTFLNDYFKASYVADYLYPIINGYDHSEIGNGLKLRYDNGTNQTRPQTMSVLPGGVSEFKIPVGGDLAISYAGDYKSVLFSFGFEGISNSYSAYNYNTQDTVMARILNFLDYGRTPNTLSNPNIDTVGIIGTNSLISVNDYTPEFSWKLSDTTANPIAEYEIQIGTGLLCGMTDNMWSPGFISGSDTSIVYDGVPLESGGIYFFNLRVSNGVTWSTWYSAKFIMNTIGSPGTPISPINDALVNTTTPTLTVTNGFDPNGDELTYEFEVYADQALTILITSVTGVAETPGSTDWVVDVSLVEDTRYFWRHRTYDGSGYSAYSSTGSFYINAVNLPPSTFNLSEPVDEQEFTGITPTLIWELSIDADPMDAVKYSLWYSLDSLFNSYSEITNINDTTITVSPGLTMSQKYFWKVKAYDIALSETWSTETFAFYTGGKGCCVGIRGNVNGDLTDAIDIEDLVFFVEYSFGEPAGPEPVCFEEADVDASAQWDIEDIVYLVEYMFGEPTGPAPVDCYLK